MHNKCIEKESILDFMAGSSLIFSGFAITANDMKSQIIDFQEKIDMFEQDNIIEWAPLSIVAKKKGLTKDAIRKQLQNGDYEEGVDFKYEGNKIVVHQGAIGRLQRKRRSSNG